MPPFSSVIRISNLIIWICAVCSLSVFKGVLCQGMEHFRHILPHEADNALSSIDFDVHPIKNDSEIAIGEPDDEPPLMQDYNHSSSVDDVDVVHHDSAFSHDSSSLVTSLLSRSTAQQVFHHFMHLIQTSSPHISSHSSRHRMNPEDSVIKGNALKNVKKEDADGGLPHQQESILMPSSNKPPHMISSRMQTQQNTVQQRLLTSSTNMTVPSLMPPAPFENSPPFTSSLPPQLVSTYCSVTMTWGNLNNASVNATNSTTTATNLTTSTTTSASSSALRCLPLMMALNAPPYKSLTSSLGFTLLLAGSPASVDSSMAKCTYMSLQPASWTDRQALRQALESCSPWSSQLTASINNTSLTMTPPPMDPLLAASQSMIMSCDDVITLSETCPENGDEIADSSPWILKCSSYDDAFNSSGCSNPSTSPPYLPPLPLQAPLPPSPRLQAQSTALLPPSVSRPPNPRLSSPSASLPPPRHPSPQPAPKPRPSPVRSPSPRIPPQALSPLSISSGGTASRQLPPVVQVGATASNGLSLQDIQSILSIHNTYRANYQAPPLSWSNQLAVLAQTWGSNCVFTHSSPYSYGENLALGYGTVTTLTALWYTAECCSYNYSSPGFTAGHFTQMVWQSTTSIGCAMMGPSNSCPSISNPGGGNPYTGAHLLICEYSPAGNFGGLWSMFAKTPLVAPTCQGSKLVMAALPSS